ncbi:hypothetical protein [Silvimonas amylolytica]|uniref:HdeA/HdeB family protein n=1 Tax=Silvimonas amylolytica TaxID=449663 RepID=A0ABQ2PJI2_9NEIS|nr:hypothetical protein [Silvimonas amylolytica]GGP25386.1 hypothetical protein GCM10010971_12050 [Silvimonas amylolytica]
MMRSLIALWLLSTASFAGAAAPAPLSAQNMALYTYVMGRAIKADCEQTYPEATSAIEANWQRWHMAQPEVVADFRGERAPSAPPTREQLKRMGNPAQSIKSFWCQRLDLYMDFGTRSSPTAVAALQPWLGEANPGALVQANDECRKLGPAQCGPLEIIASQPAPAAVR